MDTKERKAEGGKAETLCQVVELFRQYPKFKAARLALRGVSACGTSRPAKFGHYPFFRFLPFRFPLSTKSVFIRVYPCPSAVKNFAARFVACAGGARLLSISSSTAWRAPVSKNRSPFHLSAGCIFSATGKTVSQKSDNKFNAWRNFSRENSAAQNSKSPRNLAALAPTKLKL